MSSTAKVHHPDADTLVVESGGELRIAAGGKLTAAGTQAAAVEAVDVTYTTGDPSITPNGAVTIADGATPTVDELLEYCEELNAKLTAIQAALEGAGITAAAS